MSKPKLHEPEGMHILFADDEANLQELMRKELPRMGYRVTVCPDGITAVETLRREPVDCLLVDINMPGMTGIEVIAAARDIRPNIDAIVMTGKPTRDTAIEALRHGTFDYLTKPCKLSELATLLGRVSQRRETNQLVAALQHRLARAEGNDELIGQHESMDGVRRLIQKVAPSSSTVLIRGETGSGKELVARAVHRASLRADEPFVAINCGALPESLIESELFGHVKGAFTGADASRTGLFEVAEGGTLFLDEIGELPLAIQAKLLRVLETGDIRRLGDNQNIHVDVRIVCATHRNLEQMVLDGAFREDLMFRINTFEVRVPPLRERIDDLPSLAAHLIRRHRQDGDEHNLFTPDALRLLQSHTWPGNVRELANVIEHGAVMCEQLPLDVDSLPQHFAARQLRPSLQAELQKQRPMTMRELEQFAIEHAMERHNGNKKAVAEELGVSVKTLYNRLSKPEDAEAA